jgi:hypothetical protein
MNTHERNLAARHIACTASQRAATNARRRTRANEPYICAPKHQHMFTLYKLYVCACAHVRIFTYINMCVFCLYAYIHEYVNKYISKTRSHAHAHTQSYADNKSAPKTNTEIRMAARCPHRRGTVTYTHVHAHHIPGVHTSPQEDARATCVNKHVG